VQFNLDKLLKKMGMDISDGILELPKHHLSPHILLMLFYVVNSAVTHRIEKIKKYEVEQVF